ncbi:hypothetical protein EAF04_009077 [Stromatinia cepivora]|nr:hypothetical protein EAF04_009077 [Stromatinia cepivora]
MKQKICLLSQATSLQHHQNITQPLGISHVIASIATIDLLSAAAQLHTMDRQNLDKFFWGTGRLFGLCITFCLEYARYMLREILEKTPEGPTHEPIRRLGFMLALLSFVLQVLGALDGFTPTVIKVTCFLAERSSKITRLLLWTLQPLFVNFIMYSSMVIQLLHFNVLFFYVQPETTGMILEVLRRYTPSESCQEVHVYKEANGSFHAFEM